MIPQSVNHGGHEELSSSSRAFAKRPGEVESVCNRTAGEVETGRSSELSGHPSELTGRVLG